MRYKKIQDIRAELINCLQNAIKYAENTRCNISKFTHSKNAIKSVDLIVKSLINATESSEELYKRAITDGLTQVFNRAYFEEVLKPSISQKTNCAIILTDIDDFGEYNNTYGHQQGDTALRTVASIINKEAKTSPVARYGGEEFSILLVEYSNKSSNASSVAEKVRISIDKARMQPFSLDAIIDGIKRSKVIKERARKCLRTLKSNDEEKVLSRYFPRDKDVYRYIKKLRHITVSVGVAVRNDRESAEHVIYRADKALYEAKNSGRNKVVTAKV